MTRVYLDWNATAPLRPEAREAMLAAMEAVGNPSSAHTEGRAAKAIIETARGQVARLVGCEPGEVVFTSGATEAMALAVTQFARFEAAPIEHDCVCAYASSDLTVSANGHVRQPVPKGPDTLVAIQAANGETGILQPLHLWDGTTNNLVDAAQALTCASPRRRGSRTPAPRARPRSIRASPPLPPAGRGAPWWSGWRR